MSREAKGSVPMISVDEALRVVLEAAGRPLPSQIVPLEESIGRALAEEIRGMEDMPRFDRSAMDGFAVRVEDFATLPATLEIVEEIYAGRDPQKALGPGQCAKIMTGAAIPGGAGAVIMVELAEIRDGGRRVRFRAAPPAGEHIRRKGEDLRAGSVLLEPGAAIGAAEAALLAAEGRARVAVGGRPSVALLSTGDELVGIDETPQGSRIRETNSWSLLALLRQIGIEPARLGVAKDEVADLERRIGVGLRHDLLVLTGGVSMGERDHVGEVLKSLGCRPIFERVAIQPGKPLFFGVVESSGRRTIVFGLPGNPVSSIVDFLVFARPALRRMMGFSRWADPSPAAVLASPMKHRPGRRGYFPVRVEVAGDGALVANPLPSMGSADVVALSRANALGIVPESAGALPEGASLRLMFLDAARG